METTTKNYKKINLILILIITIELFLMIICFLSIRHFYVIGSNIKPYIEKLEGENISNFNIVKSSQYNEDKIFLYTYSKGKINQKILGITISEPTFINGLYRNVYSGSYQGSFGVLKYPETENPAIIIYGYNPKNIAKFITLNSDGKRYSLDMPYDNYYFCIFDKIQSNLDISDITFYDDNKVEISKSHLNME